MSESCRINPLEQLGSKTNPLFSSQNRTHFPNQSTNSDTISQYESKESIFFNQGQQSLPFAQPQQPISPTLSKTTTITDRDSLSDEWLTQFSSMKVHDPLEFSNDYKRWYEKYTLGGKNITRREIEKPQINKSINNGAGYRPLLTKGYQSGYIPVRRTQTTTFHRTVTTPLSAPATGEHSIDSYFDLEFINLENELQNEQTNSGSKTSSSMNFEQIAFQKAATDIVKTCSLDIPSSPERTTRSQLQSKFASSKFMGLMRKVSDGVVTVKDTKKELFTPETNEVVGNEYFPVLDER